jgi:hypothetical protein
MRDAQHGKRIPINAMQNDVNQHDMASQIRQKASRVFLISGNARSDSKASLIASS